MPRATPDVIDTAMSLMVGLTAPDNFKVWTAISAISSILARRVWLPNNVGLPPAYPNLFIMYVGEPATGKDITIGWGTQLLLRIQEEAAPRTVVTLGPQSISQKGIYDAFDDGAEQVYTYQSRTHQFNSVIFHIPELSTIMTDYDSKLIGVFNDLYNCGPWMRDRIRGRNVSVKNPHATLLFGNQPDTLFEVFPEKVFGMGFTSRLMFIQCFEQVRGILFTHDNKNLMNSELYNMLVTDLLDISLITGPYECTIEVKEALNEFSLQHPDEVPGRKWKHYNGRRTLHLSKLCMICAASERSKKLIEMRHLERAYNFMRDYEKDLPRLFDNIISSRGFVEIYDQINNFLKDKKEIKHSELSYELSRTRTIQEVRMHIDEFLREGLLEIKRNYDLDPPQDIKPRTYIVRKY